MELGSATGPPHASEPSLRSHEALGCEPVRLRHTKCDESAVSEENQSAARAQQPCRLRDPAHGIAPHARPVLADYLVERGTSQRHVLRIGLDERKHRPEALLATGCGAQCELCHGRERVTAGRDAPAG
jgi:hypothetical protein